MACFTVDEMVDVLFRYMPPWFDDENPILEAILAGFGSVAAFIYCNLVYIKLQTRIKTATDINLDYIAQDFFGDLLKRCPGESDASFLSRILKLLLAKRVTKQAMIDRLTDLTGRTPIVYQGFNSNGGAFCNHTAFCNGNTYAGFHAAYQAWITAYRPLSPTVNTTAFANNSAFCNGESYYGSISENTGCVSDDDILRTIEITKLEGTLIHVTILD